MSSMRRMNKVLESEQDNTSGSHCLVEWLEEGSPRSVVEKKKVVWIAGIGQTCEVRITERSKTALYKAKLIACGKLK